MPRCLGGMKNQDMAGIGLEYIAQFRDEQGRRFSPATANVFLKITRIIFAAAESITTKRRRRTKASPATRSNPTIAAFSSL